VIPQQLRAILAMLAATACFVANDTFVKIVVDDLPPLQTLFLRGVSAFLWCLPVVLALGQARALPLAFSPIVVLRGLGELAAVICFFIGLAKVPIADITAIAQTTPLVVIMAAAVFFGEPVGRWRWALILVGFAGAILVAQPDAAGISVYAALGFATALGASVRDLLSRRLPPDLPAMVGALSIILVVMLGALVATMIAEDWRPVTLRHVGLMACSGFFLMLAQLAILQAYRIGPAALVAPFFYSMTLWAVVSGLVVFNNWPSALQFAGMALIVVSGLALARLGAERRSPEG
jgi:drug/metabolite transporter (DMT)-like permease